MPEQTKTRDIREFARQVVAAQEAARQSAPVRSETYAGEPLSGVWNAADRLGQAHKMSPEDRLAFDSNLTKYRNEAEMWAMPKEFWIENNVPLYGDAFKRMRKAFEDSSKVGPIPVDGGEL